MSVGASPERRPVGHGREKASIGDYVLVLLDEWRTLVLPLVIVVLGAVGYLLLAVPSYVATGVIQVSATDPSGASALFDMTGISRPSPVETEVEILRSRRILVDAIRQLCLNVTVDQPPLTLDFGVSLGGSSPLDPDLVALRNRITELRVADWVEQPLAVEFTAVEGGAIQVRLDGNDEAVTVQPGGVFEQSGVSFGLRAGPGPTVGETIEAALAPDDLLATSVLENLSVESIGGRKDTNLVRIAAAHADRKVARDLVNALMESYMDFALEWRTLRADRSARFIEGQIDAIREGLERSEKELQEFIEQTGAVLLPEQAKELIQGGSELELEMRKVRIQEELLSTVASEIRRASKSGQPVALTGDFLFEDELLGKAIGVLNDLEIKRETLMADMTETHPEVIRLGEEIRRVRGQVLEYVSASRDRVRERRRSLGRSLDEIQVELSGFPDKERQMAGLRRKLDVSQQLYSFLMTKLEEARIVKASTTTDKRIIDRATTPNKRTKPRRMTTLVFAGLLGLLLGIGAVFLRRVADPRIRDEEEAKQLGGLPVYGVIPDLKSVGVSGRIDELWEVPKGPAAEAFRTLRTNVEFAQVGEAPLKIVQITSSEASEGKSTVISNLAVALSKAGHRVLVVDLDLRRPAQHQLWGQPRSPGISDHLVGRTDLPLRRSEQWKVAVIPAGNEPPESQRLLASDRLAELVTAWREEYDYILLDTPPLLVADSLVISKLSDMVLFVVRPRTSRRASLKVAQQTHAKMDLVKGMVINGVTTRRGGYYHYYRGSYYGSRTTDTQET
jgi:capsular exopolysaccharide synthesis family protein